MPERDGEVFSNPLPPPEMDLEEEDDSHQPLTNDDFRKLLMTPRHPSASSSSAAAASLATPTPQQKPAVSSTARRESDELGLPEGEGDAAEKRKKKKSYYAQLKKLEDERQKELAQKYRDRANERRSGHNKDYEETEIISTTADYRAVAPDAKAGENYAERRKQLIQESKYLGGDMEHTHLVKGLDYALLEKVRAEITSKERQDEDLEEVLNEKKEDEEEPQIQFRTKLGRNIFRSLFRRQAPERNELFIPGRMAYVVELEDDFAESDVPTTLIRSKADLPSMESTTTLTTNDIVIQKLTQILSYLRQGRRDAKKLKKKDKGKVREEQKDKIMEDGIYGEIGDYRPSFDKPKDSKDRKHGDREHVRDRDRERDRDRDPDRDRGRYRERDRRDRDRHDRDRHRDDRDRRRDRDRGGDREREKKKSYFEKPAEEEEESEHRPINARDMVKNINDKFAKGWAPADIEREAALEGGIKGDSAPTKKPTKDDEMKKRIQNKLEIDSYAECYPGQMESYDAIDDSDDEVDYTKMDMGNKKGPVGRWDFDTQEEYSDYMSHKEAMPKAAFQYGVKMADGRKTRRTGPKDEKAQLDREWQKIQNIIAKRKQMATDGEPYAKTPKY